MAITSAVKASSATPAGDFYTLVTGVMTTGGWTLLDTLTAAEAGNTGDASENVVVPVWGNTASIATATCFIYISTNESGTAPPRLRFRVSEGYDDTGVQPGPIHPCPGYASNQSNTPASNDSVGSSETSDNVVLYQATGVSQKVAWVDVAVSANGFSYIIGANAFEVVVATSVISGAAGGVQWFHGGKARTTESLSPSTVICYIGGQHSQEVGKCTSWPVTANTNIGAYRVSREPNTGAVATIGAFCYSLDAVMPRRAINVAWGGAPGVAHKWLTSMAGYTGYLHGAHNTVSLGAIRSHLTKLSSIATVGYGSVATMRDAVSIGDTVTINGSTYYMLGTNDILSTTAGIDFQCNIVCAKSSAF
jgi:hypothetical protein